MTARSSAEERRGRLAAAHRPACAAPSSTTRLMWSSAPESSTARARFAGTGAHCQAAVSNTHALIMRASTGSA